MLEEFQKQISGQLIQLQNFKIKGFEIVPERLFKTFVRARSALHVPSSLKFKVREDLMSDDFPDVWIETSGGKKHKRRITHWLSIQRAHSGKR